MIVRILRGRNLRVQPPMIIFKNKYSSYPIRGPLVDIPVVCYRSGPKEGFEVKDGGVGKLTTFVTVAAQWPETRSIHG